MRTTRARKGAAGGAARWPAHPLLYVLAAAAGLAPVGEAEAFRILAPTPGAVGSYLTELRPNARPPFVHWDLRRFAGGRIPWQYATTGTPDINGDGDLDDVDEALAQQAFVDAFQVWETQPNGLNASVQRGDQPPGALASPDLALDGSNFIFFKAHVEGDDVQAIGVGLPVPPVANLICVTPGNDGLLETAPRGDDVVVGNNITTGRDGTCQTEKNNLGPWPGPLGRTSLIFENATGRILDSDVVLSTAADPGATWRRLGHGDPLAAPQADIQTVAMHEIGHSLGIAHPEAGADNPNHPWANVGPFGGAPGEPTGPIMNPEMGTGGNGVIQAYANHKLTSDDKRACSFLYSPDLGDAPHIWPTPASGYPTLIQQAGGGPLLNGAATDTPLPGAAHLFGPGMNDPYEFLEGNVSAEIVPREVDKDLSDEGVTPKAAISGGPFTVTGKVWFARDAQGLMHDYTTDPAYLSIWIDKNCDGAWETAAGDADERWVHENHTPVIPEGASKRKVWKASGTKNLPAWDVMKRGLGNTWVRARVDWGQDAGARALGTVVDASLNGPAGPAQFGEVEDHRLIVGPPGAKKVDLRNGGVMEPSFVRATFRGDATGQPFQFARVNPAGCADFAYPDSVVEVSFDSILNETVLELDLDTLPPIPPMYGMSIAAAVSDSAPAAFLLCTMDVAPLGARRYPLTHCGYGLLTDSLTVEVATLDQDNGGYPWSQDDSTGKWSDTMFVLVSYRVSPSEVPLNSLNVCNSLIEPLPVVAVAVDTIFPDRPFRFQLGFPGDIDVGESLLLQVRSWWKRNTNVSEEMLQFVDPFGQAVTAVAEASPPAARGLAFESFPNPFNPSTSLRYVLLSPGRVTLTIHDLTGRLVRKLEEAEGEAGEHVVLWDGRDAAGMPVASGLYVARLLVGDVQEARKVLLLR